MNAKLFDSPTVATWQDGEVTLQAIATDHVDTHWNVPPHAWNLVVLRHGVKIFATMEADDAILLPPTLPDGLETTPRVALAVYAYKIRQRCRDDLRFVDVDGPDVQMRRMGGWMAMELLDVAALIIDELGYEVDQELMQSYYTEEDEDGILVADNFPPRT